jgi:hypothetical protein
MDAKTPRSGEPASVEQLGSALVALGMYTGTNSAAEHAQESTRFGAEHYRMRLVNALLGADQIAAAPRRWAVVLDDGGLVFANSDHITAE